jgi:hypothetical protein
MKRMGVLLLAGALLLAACSKEKEAEPGGDAGSCPSPAAALATDPTLPSGFPDPDEVTFTSTKMAGPTTIVEGYWDGDLADAYEGWRAATAASGYDVTFSEKEADDAEVNFSGGHTTGQIKLTTGECEARTDVKITIRPD